MHYYIKAIKNYAVFTGRARRSEYWYFALFNFLFAIAAMILDNMLHLTFSIDPQMPAYYGYIYAAYGLFTIIPGLAVFARRMHDIGKSGWNILWGIIPIIGFIYVLILLFRDSQPGENKWGPNPKGIGNYDEIERLGEHLQSPN